MLSCSAGPHQSTAPFAGLGLPYAEIGADGCLSNATFLVDDGNDLGIHNFTPQYRLFIYGLFELCLETRKAATKKAAAITQSPMFCYFGAMKDFSSNETPHFPARLLSLFFVVKNRGKRIKTNQQILEISGIFRFVFIIVYGHSHATLPINMGIPVKLVSERLGHEKYRNDSKNVFSPL